MSHIILPRRRALFTATGPGTGNTSWANWDEVTAAGWGDQANNWILIESNPVLGGNDNAIGGGLAGVDLVATEAGGLPGALGAGTVSDPYRRLYDGTDDIETMTQAVANLITGGGNWTVIVKLKITAINANEAPFDFHGANDHIYTIFDAAGKITFRMQKDAANPLNVLSTDAMDTGEIGYIALWVDGTYLRGGFIDGGSPSPNTKPTKWSDFNANDRGSATDTIAYSAGDFVTVRSLGAYATFFLNADIYYFLVSKTCLIDNNA